MMGSLDVAVSGMVAQRRRLDVISANIANADTTRTPEGGPWRRRVALFSAGATEEGGLGVRLAEIAQDPSDFRLKWDPTHPDAAQADDPGRGVRKGYLQLPNVNSVVEQIDAMGAVRSYEANLAAAEAAKAMAATALQLLA